MGERVVDCEEGVTEDVVEGSDVGRCAVGVLSFHSFDFEA